jgi:hypothetical protein
MKAKASISQQARQLLADAYTAQNKPWFASEILKGWSQQFDTTLILLTQLLDAPPKKYCKYDLPGVESIDEYCTCHWCNPVLPT